MKRILSLTIVLLLAMIPFSMQAAAAEADIAIVLAENQDIFYFDDGSYVISTLIEEPAAGGGFTILAATSTKSASRYYDFFNSDKVLQWTAKLTGNFSYNGSSATCTASSVSHTIYGGSWKLNTSSASRSGAQAIGNHTFKYYVLLIPVQTENVRQTITCSPSGVLS